MWKCGDEGEGLEDLCEGEVGCACEWEEEEGALSSSAEHAALTWIVCQKSRSNLCA